jgi:hypothetical protein
MTDFNPFLARASNGAPARSPIERYDQIENLCWQTRAAPPSEYENRLGDALEAAFDQGATELAALVTHLNQTQLRAPDGAAWTEASLAAELKRLGA